MIIKKIFDEFIYGGHLLSLGVASILWTTSILFEKEFNIFIGMAGYSVGQIIYLYNHYREIEFDARSNPERVKHQQRSKHSFYLILGIYFVLFFVVSYFLNHLYVFVLFSLTIVGGILFTEYFKEVTCKILGFKNLYTAFYWALLVIISSIYYNLGLNLEVIILFLFVFIRWLVNTIYFDFKDVDSDRERKLKTLPVIFGTNKTLIILHFLNFLSFLDLIIGVLLDALPMYSLALFMLSLYTLIYLSTMLYKNIDLKKISYILVDGEYVLWPFIIILSALIFI